MSLKLQDKVALITGSDSGIGQGIAIEFAMEGAHVVVHYFHDRAGAEHTADEVRRLGQRALIVQADVRDEAAIAQMFTAALAEFQTVDILVNNAGVDSAGKHVADMDTETWDNAIRTNVYGPFFCTRRFINIRKAAGGGGRIINITSVHEEQPHAGGAEYDASKGALRNLTRTLALEVAPLGINVNNIGPGMVLTPFNQKAIDDPNYRRAQTEGIPLKRAAEPFEVGKVAVFLASNDANYVTGSTYFIDGGLMRSYGQGA